MSSSKKDLPRDLDLKLMVRTLFRLLGCHTEVELPLLVSSYRPKYGRPYISDIDALGVRFETDLRRSIFVAECKSGGEKAAEQLLKLWGVMTYFDADRGYLVKGRVADNAREMGRHRGVVTLDQGEMESLLSSLGCDVPHVTHVERAIYAAEASMVGALQARGSGALFAYVTREYWNREDWENIHNVVYFLTTLRDKADKAAPEDRHIIFRLLSLLNLSVLALSSEVLSMRLSDIGRGVDLGVFGGPRGRRDRERLHDLFAQAGAGRRAGPAVLDPAFLEPLKQVVAFLLRSPDHASRTPLLLQRVMTETYLSQAAANAAPLEEEFTPETRKLAKDVCDFGLKAAGFGRPSDFIGELLQL